MRSIRIDFGPDPIDAASAIRDVRLAVALLVGAASKAEEELARTTGPTRAALATAGPLGKIIRSCNEFETAVNTAHLPSPPTLKTIDAVEAARAAMPHEKTRATIAIISRAIAAVNPCVEAVEREASVGSRSLSTANDRRLD
jgi:hypothetical protein